jgi:DNA topoisomerase-2
MSSNKLEKKYQKKSQLEHIKDLPDTYIGSTELTVEQQYVYENERIIKKEVSYVPGLLNIWTEILVNAIDHHTRCHNDKNEDNVKYINVSFDIPNNKIIIRNEGSIEIAKHPTILDENENAVYIPELIFSHLLTSSNYDKSEKKIVGGKNGYGAKLTNIFSDEFKIVTIHNGNKYIQVFRNNMSEKDTPKITKCSTKPYTEISFIPDLKRFGMKKLDKDMISLMKKRVIDATACTEKYLTVELDGKKLTSKTLEQYMDFYFNDKVKKFICRPHDYWEIGVTSSNDGKMEHVSFVNGISTSKGGKHVDYIINQIVKQLTPIIEKKIKKPIKANYIKDNLFIFIRSTIVNPSFDSQTKEYLTTNQTKFGSKCELDKKFIEKIAKSDIVDKIIQLNDFKENMLTKKTDGKKKYVIKGIPKLEDANKAGTIHSSKCILNLTEGDSAKAFVMGGIENKDYEGVFPLKGKLLNVRGETVKVANNTEISALKQILGLKEFEQGTNKPKEYTSLKELRYGKIRLCMDQDVDGSHIKGLFMNLIFCKWPSLLKFPGFIISLVTPIVKASCGKKVKSFYTLTDYNNWKKTVDMKKWSIKYYKGLGTSTSKEAKEYFSKLDENTTVYTFTEECGESIDLAFDKKLTDKRKEWLNNYNPDDIIERNEKNVSFNKFIHKDLIHFSNYDNERSIPSLCDGLKPSQRKVVYTVISRNLTASIKVSQLAGSVSEKSSYHHGEASLQSTIIGLAQDYMGSNNVNMLSPEGQFGTRLLGGKDHASPRYIYTKMESIMKYIFHKDDNYLLNYLDDDGFTIEPEYYLPVIPMILVNGAEGIGTGFSTKIPCYNPLDIIECLLDLLKDKEIKEITPWYKNFEGEILIPKWNGKKYEDIDKMYSKGVYTIQKNVIKITELPIGIWTNNYKEYLESIMIDAANKKTACIESYKSSCSDTKVEFEIKFNSDKLSDLIKSKKLETVLKMKESKNVNISNIHLHDRYGKIKKYETVSSILKEFYEIRLEYYHKRYKYLNEKHKYELSIIDARIKFVEGIISDEIIIFKKEDDEITEILEKYDLPKISKISFEDVCENDEKSYDYLLNMPMRTMSKRKLDELNKQFNDKADIAVALKKQTAEDLWKEDLKMFKKEYLKTV